MTLAEGIAAIEAVMFAYGDPITIEKLSEASGVDAETCVKLVDRLEQQYNVRESGLRILRINNGFQIAAVIQFGFKVVIKQHFAEHIAQGNRLPHLLEQVYAGADFMDD